MAYTTRFGKIVSTKRKVIQRFNPPPAPSKSLRKGQYLGACNRSACLAPGAKWYNRGSYAFYCTSCAHMLNHANRHDEFCKDASLCRLIETQEEAEKLHIMERS